MSTIFHRLNTDRTRIPVRLEDLFAGPTMSACWLIGGGPSLLKLPHETIGRSPTPKMCVNLAGTRLLRPTFWTSYDPSIRFHRSVYLDPGVMKFLHRRRAMDLVPETSFKVCDCPNTYFFERDGKRGFADFLSPDQSRIVDWADTMVQAIDILYRLGFRIIYLAGCEMRVHPSPEQIRRAADAGVQYDPGGLLQDFLRECNQAGLSAEELDSLPPGAHYHFDEHKPIRSAANTDGHYFRVSQYLRLSRRSLVLAGLQLISVTPQSRLNDYFPYVDVEQVLGQIEADVGNYRNEPVSGLYRQMEERRPQSLGPMRDFRPHNWRADEHARPQPFSRNGAAAQRIVDGELIVEAEGFERLVSPNGHDDFDRRSRLATELKRIPDGFIDPCEEG